MVETPEATTPQQTEATGDEASLLGSAGTEEGEGGGATEAAATEAATVPEAYEITLTDAEGNPVEVDAGMLEEATPVLREAGLNNEQATKLAPLALKLMERGAAEQEARGEQMLAAAKKEWLDQFKASDLGGGKTEATMHTAAKAMDALGFTQGHPFRDLLNVSGLGNHPDMIATFYRLGSLLSEETTFANPEGASETKAVGHTDLYKD